MANLKKSLDSVESWIPLLALTYEEIAILNSALWILRREYEAYEIWKKKAVIDNPRLEKILKDKEDSVF